MVHMLSLTDNLHPILPLLSDDLLARKAEILAQPVKMRA